MTAMMRMLPALLAASLCMAESGQGTAEPGCRVEGLNLGAYWYGAKISHEDLVGKVVLVELWGS